jgi:hypothetical protein
VGSYTKIVSGGEGVKTVGVSNIGKVGGGKLSHCVVCV